MKYLAIMLAGLMIASTIWVISASASAPEEQPEPSGYTPSSPIRIDDDLELAAVASSGSGVFGDPWIIDELEIDATGDGFGIYIGNCTEYWRIEQVNIDNATGVNSHPWAPDSGIVLYNTHNGNISFTNVTYCWNYGIYLNASYNIEMYYNRLIANENRGITMEAISHDVEITRCWVNGTSINITTYGISAYDEASNLELYYNSMAICTTGIAFNDVESSNIEHNWINTGTCAIVMNGTNSIIIEHNHFVDPQIGMWVMNSHDLDIYSNDFDYHNVCCLLLNNTYGTNVTGNDFYAEDAWTYNGIGVFLVAAPYNNFTDNSFTKCNMTGFNISDPDSFGNLIWDNGFSNNNGDNAQDINGVGWWNTSTTGNSWDDYTGSDITGDGIGETAYVFDTNADYYPQCTAYTFTPGGGGGPLPTDTVLPTEPAPEAETSDFELNLGWMFWGGAILLFIGFAKLPVPFVKGKELMLIGGFLLVLNFIL